MAGIQLSGLASGLDSQTIISELMSVESQPRTRMAQQQVVVQARQDALRQIDTKLTNLKLAATDLRSAALWSPTQAVTTSDEDIVTARQLSGAPPGGYQVTVSSLASADSRTYDWTDGGGDLSVNYNVDGAAQSKTFTLAGQSLDEAVATINGDSSSPVWAVNVGGKLSLSRKETGDHAAWGFDASGPAIGALRSSRDGTDAAYTIAGDTTTYTSHTNVATAGLPGVELTLQGTGTATVNVSTPAADPTKVSAKLKAFVSAYNDAVDFVRGKLTEKTVPNPQSNADAVQGVLFGDTALSGVLSSMRQVVSEAGLDALGVQLPAAGTGNTPDAQAGKLTFDQPTFDAAWAADPNQVRATLGSTDAAGFAQALEAVLDPVTRSGDGLLDERVSQADDEISSIKDNLANMDLRLQAKQDYLQQQFTNLETILSQSQSTQQSLANSLFSS
jgi:flagellar hook-associated protein 2